MTMASAAPLQTFGAQLISTTDFVPPAGCQRDSAYSHVLHSNQLDQIRVVLRGEQEGQSPYNTFFINCYGLLSSRVRTIEFMSPIRRLC